MDEDFIGRQIRRTNRNLVLLGTVLAGLVGLVLAANWGDVQNYVLGPFPTPIAELRAPSPGSPPQRFYVRIKGERSFHSGTQVVKHDEPGKVVGQIVGVQAGPQVLLVEAPTYVPEILEYRGVLRGLPGDLRSRVEGRFSALDPKARPSLVPCLLEAKSVWDTDSVLVSLLAALVAGSGIAFAGVALRRLILPERHPLLVRLGVYGDVRDIRSRINEELAAEEGGLAFGPLRVTTNWILNAAAYKTAVMAAQEVVWAYAKVTKHYHNGIPTGTTYTVMVRDARGTEMEVKGKKNTVPQLIEDLQRRMPWILIGYSKELDLIWKKDRPKFLEMAASRRRAP